MSSIANIKEAIRLCGAARITPFIWGFHGLGKSSVVKQIASENGWGCVDLRCSQIEASDIRGLPDKSKGRTIYLPPADMPVGDLSGDDLTLELVRPFLEDLAEARINYTELKPQEQLEAILTLASTDMDVDRRYRSHLKAMQPRFQRGIMFLDEINRAADDVLQAAFQFVQDREIGQYVLPPGWMLVAAGNYTEGYQTGGFLDGAFLDRFCHIDFPRGDTSLDDWVSYMHEVHGDDASEVIEFTTSDVQHLDGKMDGERGFSVQPSRRSWDSVIRVLKLCKVQKYSDIAKLLVLQGLVGTDLGNTFFRYNCPVKPRDVLTHGVERYRSAINDLNRGQISGLMWALSTMARDKITDERIAGVCLDFAEILAKHRDKDLTVAFCKQLLTTCSNDGQDRTRVAVISNPTLAKMIGAFNKKSGAKKTFLDYLLDRPALQGLIAEVSWGGTGNDE